MTGLAKPSRLWQTLRRAPGSPQNLAWPILVGGILLVIAWQVLQWQTSYLVQNSYSGAAKSFVTSVSAPIGEESLKIGLGIVVGSAFSGIASVGTWLGQKRRGERRSGIYPLMMRAWRRMSLLVFLIVTTVFAISESLGGGLDTGVVTPLGAVLKLLAHPSFSILAVVVSLEAKPRTVLLVALGYGFHSTMNLIVGHLTGWVESAAYFNALFLIMVFDVWVLFRWYPSIPATIQGVFRRRATN